MKLIGMLDSPYVRRVAICLKLLKLDFEHASISVFSTYDQFAQINPVVKAPTLIADNGSTVMESSVILQYLATLAGPGQRLFSTVPEDALRAARLSGLALAACEKSIQIVYERNLRPVEKQHEPWLERVRAQLLAAYAELEREVAAAALPIEQEQFDAADVTVAVSWHFTQMMLPEIVDKAAYPHLQAFSALAEDLPVFVETPAV
ncbi:glutathione S-transferase N-terminal domain-containing protein [Paraburkholderia fynbosensis]|uniref:Putative GST-like protein YibF n=1 Tax=Paraburkholderia fynbosensis TaxID=1200993 RepID=A0A6J5H3D4_9BURK|nr:glutathione S-transferase N-terminal domain-containing protein [Paraburkholderia fynbosensis]CAB3810392.1 putative GST-like protein YibF [Paraburkholderia fynbosensis]